MAKDDKFTKFLEAKDICVENLQSLKSSIIQCIDEKRVDAEDRLLDQLQILIDGAPLMESWEELRELISQSKILEEEIDAWLSIHELTSYSLPWPITPIR